MKEYVVRERGGDMCDFCERMCVYGLCVCERGGICATCVCV